MSNPVIKLKTVGIILFGVLLLTGMSSLAMARDVSFAWDTNTEPEVVGYKVYYRVGAEAGPYNGTGLLPSGSPINVGNKTSASVSNLLDTQTYCFAVTAYSASGLESEFSSEVCVQPTSPVCTDNDGDGFSVVGGACGTLDCNDTKSSIFPGAVEICNDGIDNNCNGLADAKDSACAPVCTDADGDSFALEGGSCGTVDPDDNDSSNYPGAPVDTSGSDNGTVNVNNSWQTVAFNSTGSSTPVVIAGVPTLKDREPGSVRVRNVTRSQFDIAFQEWSYLDGNHAAEDIPYLVLEPGRYQMDDGTIWEVGRFELGKSGSSRSTSVTFNQAFSITPTVFLTVQSANDSTPLKALVSRVGTSGFVASLAQEQALAGTDHGTETIGYLAIHTPNTVGKELRASGRVTMGGEVMPYLMRTWYLSSQTSTVFSQSLMLQEEASVDSELTHRWEKVAVLAIGDRIFAQSQKSDLKDVATVRRLAPAGSSAAALAMSTSAPVEWGTVTLVGQDETVVPLGRQFTNPVVVVKAATQKGAGLGTVRVTGVQADSFTVRFQDWDYKAKGSKPPKAASIQLFYLVAEAGEYELNGLAVKAGKGATSRTFGSQGGSWQAVSFPSSFGQVPALFTSVVTVNDGAAVTSRTDHVTTGGFDLALQEEEGSDNTHAAETVGWIAIEPGSTTSLNGQRLDVMVLPGAMGSKVAKLKFETPYSSSSPVVIGDLSSCTEGDPGLLRIKKLQPNMLQLFFQEEKSADKEKRHAMEDLSLFIAE